MMAYISEMMIGLIMTIIPMGMMLCNKEMNEKINKELENEVK